MTVELQQVSLADVEAARERIAGIALRTPLIKLGAKDTGGAEIHLKLENLQPIGSFKIRGAANAIALAESDVRARGVYTASAGNMAQGVAWCARALGARCQVIVPEHAPRAKTDAIEALDGEVIKVPFDEWWQVLIDHHYEGMDGLFVHPFADNAVMAGNGTVATEIFEDLHDVDAILVPYGGGGLACGIASIANEVSARTKVYAVEVDTAAPLTLSLESGEPCQVNYTRSFVDGMGSGGVSPEMWPMVHSLLAGTVVVTLPQVAKAVRTLASQVRVIAEGAGAAALAAAVNGSFEGQRVVCILSGGNIDASRLAAILEGRVPD